MKEKQLFWILFSLLGVSMFLNVDLSALYLEEPRRAMVALEMYLQDNLLVPTLYGEFYYRKPPVFNWVLLASLRTFPEHPEFACRLISVSSFLLMSLVTYWFCKKYYSERLGMFGALLVLVSVHFLFYASLFAEIDPFYSLVTYVSILSLFVFYQKQSKLLYFTVVYLLSAVGVLTKGAPSIPFLAISLFCHLVLTRDWKWFLSWQHFFGVGLFGGVLTLFALGYAEHNELSNLITAVWYQSSDQTVINHGFLNSFLHLFVFPVKVFIDLLPVSLFFPALLISAVRKKLWEHKMLRFVLVLFLGNVLVYWVSPGTRARYVYMLYPMMVILCSFLFLEASNKFKWIEKAIKSLNVVSVVLLILGLIAYWIGAGEFGLETPTATLMIVSIVAAIVIGYVVIRNQKFNQLWWLMALLIFVRFQFDLLVLPVRAEQGEHLEYRVYGERLAEITQGENLWLYKYNTTKDEASLKFGHGFYIEYNRQDIMRSINEKNCKDFFLTQDFEVENEDFELFFEFNRREDHWLLIKFRDCH